MRIADATLPPSMAPGSVKRKGGGILLAVFFASGISALLYQIVWLKYLGLIFGNTVHAAATLISADSDWARFSSAGRC
jgi:hypothetical protein